MTRAKHRAGIPVSEPTKPKKVPRPTPEIIAKKPMDTQFRKPAGNTNNEKQARITINLKKKGITERLVKVNRDVVQPENPHLIKVAVIGAANAGKSTLVNKIVGEEVKSIYMGCI